MKKDNCSDRRIDSPISLIPNPSDGQPVIGVPDQQPSEGAEISLLKGAI
jgi:hypothetical protein